MNIEEYLRKKNDEYQQQELEEIGIDKAEYNRQAFLELPKAVSRCGETELQKAFTAGLNKSDVCMQWRELKQAYKDQYLLSIGYDDGKPIVEEILGVWFNVDTNEISAEKPYDAFLDEDKCIYVEDYRIIDNIGWKDLIVGGRKQWEL